MDLRHLRAFVAVAQEGTFTRAARRLHLSQPPSSKQVRQLERELGTTLFIRRREGIELTGDGAMLLERAQAALSAFGEFEHFTSTVASRSGPLRVGIGWGLWEAVERIRSLDEPEARLAVCIAWRKGEGDHAVKEFVRSARAVFPPAGGRRTGAA